MSEELIKRLRRAAQRLDAPRYASDAALLNEAADALSRPAPVQVPEGMVVVNRDDLDYMLGAVQSVAEAAYHRGGTVCCRVGGPECCGSPVPEWSPEDEEIMSALSPVVTGMSAMLAAAPSVPVAREHDDDIKQMMKFYAVYDLVSLARIQSEHVARLQKKLPPMRDEQPRNPRFGG